MTHHQQQKQQTLEEFDRKVVSREKLRLFLSHHSELIKKAVSDDLAEAMMNMECKEENPYYRMGYKQAKTEALNNCLQANT